jgi:hypothetical protein
VLTAAMPAPKKKEAQKMSLGDFLSDQSMSTCSPLLQLPHACDPPRHSLIVIEC